ncbi:kinase-like domain-containing protein [Crassisporium funariophilum]|nr:kinase-like domain-containing protein [Crassisporium funariophilum]
MSVIQTETMRVCDTPVSHNDLIAEGPFSKVSRTWTTIKDGEPHWVVVKSASTERKFAPEPHDILKELRLLSDMLHPNIISITGSFRDERQQMQNIYMPYLPISLSDLLASPFFSPHPFPPLRVPDDDACKLQEAQFNTIAKSIMIQILCAIAYLHDNSRRIAHRDIKPGNILLTKSGRVNLIDFGISSKECEPELEKNDDLWPEYRGKLYFEVSTGAYRAPELLFGTRSYDPLAIDLWSLGATFADFFTPLRLSSDDEDDGDDDEDTEPDSEPPTSFIVPKYLRIGYPGAQWTRDTLFNGDRGEIGLAWSIFKIFGTPTSESWPEFEDLPSAKSVVFNVVPPVPLAPLLPNLPSSSPSHPSSPTCSSPLNLLSQFLVYPTSSRLRAEDAMRHAWFTDEQSVILLPREYALPSGLNHLRSVAVHEWKGRTLGEWLHSVLLAIPGG